MTVPQSEHPLLSRLRRLVSPTGSVELPLKGGLTTRGVVRVDDTVRRPVHERSAFVHGVLRHLELRRFDHAPRFLGIDSQGREILSYVEGDVHHKLGTLDREQWLAGAALLRTFHDATLDCELRGEAEVICHGDCGPGNCVFRDDMPFAFIDFDSAYPGKREEDVGHAAWMWLYTGSRTVSPEQQGSNLVDFMAAYDAAANWNQLELVLRAQQRLLKIIPRSFKWSMIRLWVQGCLGHTWRNRRRIGAGIEQRSRELAARRQSDNLAALSRPMLY